jgi:crotonobetaine/carnitine-CoA ligase
MQYATPTPLAISALAERKPDAVAFDSISTSEQFTWREVDDRCRLWADALRTLKVGHGDPVATLLPNSPTASFAWIGCGWLHAIEVPVNTDYRGDWLIHAIDNARARVVVTSQRYLTQLAAVAPSLEHVKIVVICDAEPDDAVDFGRRIRVVRGEEFFAHAKPAQDFVPPKISDVMGVIYTSGTTGPAKAVLEPWGLQAGTLDLFGGPEFENIVIYSFSPQFHSLGKSGMMLAAALDGRVVLRERFSASEFWDDTRKYGCTAAFTVSVVPHFLLAQPLRDDDVDNPVRAVIMGPVIPEVDDFKRRFGVEVYTTFGSTEVGGAFSSRERGVHGSNWRSCGRTIPDGPVEVAVVDQEDFPVGPNVVGELVVRPRHPWTMNLGYLNMPEETVHAWRNGWYHTGDAFTYDEDGNYYFFDRTKDYIRRRGENISSFEVERAVAGFPGVERSVAVAVPSEVGEDEVMVFVVPRVGERIEPAELIRFLVDRVPPFALPRYVEVTDALPTTQATMRVQKAKLRERGPTASTFDREKAGM